MLSTVVASWLHVLWVVDHSWYTLGTVECENSSSVAVLDTLKPVCLAPTTIPCSKALKSHLAHSPSEWHTLTNHVSIVSRLKNPSLTCLFLFIYTDWSGFNRWHQLAIIAFTWIHLVSLSGKEQAFLMFCPLRVAYYVSELNINITVFKRNLQTSIGKGEPSVVL